MKNGMAGENETERKRGVCERRTTQRSKIPTTTHGKTFGCQSRYLFFAEKQRLTSKDQSRQAMLVETFIIFHHIRSSGHSPSPTEKKNTRPRHLGNSRAALALMQKQNLVRLSRTARICKCPVKHNHIFFRKRPWPKRWCLKAPTLPNAKSKEPSPRHVQTCSCRIPPPHNLRRMTWKNYNNPREKEREREREKNDTAKKGWARGSRPDQQWGSSARAAQLVPSVRRLK